MVEIGCSTCCICARFALKEQGISIVLSAPPCADWVSLAPILKLQTTTFQELRSSFLIWVMMEPLQAVPSAGYCQDCSELIATMLKGGGLFRPAASTNWTKEPWSLWPTTQDCKLCKMTSTSSYGQVRGWTSFLADEHAPGMTRVTPIIGIQSSQRAIAGFQVVSGYGCNFTFSIWSENGEVWVPEDSGFEPDSRNGPGRRSLPISTRPPPDTNYGEKDFDLIRSWFATCHDHHEGCRVTTAELISEDYEAILPTRLIDIDRDTYHREYISHFFSAKCDITIAKM
ncbi:hypothetical protein HZ326_21460, partial [Fusarium oxysporum f. sp. albedinis]